MKYLKKITRVSIMFCLLFGGLQVCAQSKRTYSAEQVTRLKKLKVDVEHYPDSMKLNVRFIAEWGINDSTIVLQYRRWVKKFPNSYVIPYAIGNALANVGNPNAREFLLITVNLKQDLADAWFLLYRDAELRGDSITVKDYLKRAISADPKNADYAYYYASLFKQTDSVKYDSLITNLIERFPKSQRGAQAIFWLARESKLPIEKVGYYELLKEKYAKSQNMWFKAGMNDYFMYLSLSDPEKASEVAHSQNQEANVKLADTLITVKKLIDEQNQEKAYMLIQQVKFQDPDYTERLIIYKAKITDAAGHLQSAYDSLKYYYAKLPTDILRKEMLYYGKKLGREEKEVDHEVGEIRDKASTVATDFVLSSYLTGKEVRLSDYRGKIVLLTYWFPACGPCREEFRYFENVLQKIGKDSLAYLGLNIFPDQDPYVLPYLTKSGYSFIPLRDGMDRKKGTLPVDGAPENYLINSEGRVMFAHFRINQNNSRSLELMINELQKNKSQKEN